MLDNNTTVNDTNAMNKLLLQMISFRIRNEILISQQGGTLSSLTEELALKRFASRFSKDIANAYNLSEKRRLEFEDACGL